MSKSTKTLAEMLNERGCNVDPEFLVEVRARGYEEFKMSRKFNLELLEENAPTYLTYALSLADAVTELLFLIEEKNLRF